MTKKGKHYFHSDGNGGYNISKSLAVLTIVALIVALLTSLVSVTTYAVTNRERINHIEVYLEDSITELEEQDERLDTIDYHLAVAETKLVNIECTVKTLSNDFKEFMKEYQR